MKKKKNGFMLAELIVTATVVIAAMVGLYAGYNNVYTLYKKRNNYYNIDGIYATKEMINHYMKNDLNKIINNNLGENITSGTESSNTKYYFYIIKDNQCQDKEDITCKTIQKLYNIENMIFSEYDKCILNPNKYKCSSNTKQNIVPLDISNETFKEYIDYVINYYNIEDNNEYSYIVLTEINNNEDNEENIYYSNLRIR